MSKVINLNFERTSVPVPYDDELEKFVRTLKRDSCRDEDIHVFHAYFQLFWPIKSVVLNNTIKNFPQKYMGYTIVGQPQNKQTASNILR